MPEAADDGEVLLLADTLYIARTAVAESNCSLERVGLAELVQFLQRPDSSLSVGQQRALFANARLRADYQLIKARLAKVDLPALAAASSGRVSTRQFQGGSVHVHLSRVEDQAYVIVRICEQQKAPHSIVLENSAGEIVKRALPPVDAKGEIMLVLDRKSPNDEAFLRLISDPTSIGSLLL